MQDTERLLKLINDLRDIDEANTQHVSTLDVILCALITTLDSTQQQYLLMNLKQYAEAVQDQPLLQQLSDAALQHVSAVLATSPNQPRALLKVIRGGKTDA